MELTEIINKAGQCGLLLFLVLNTELDVKKREVSFTLTVFFSVFAILCYWGEWYLGGEQATSAWILIGGLLPGILLLLAGKVTRGQIGYGDGLAMLVCGLFLGFGQSMELLLIALFCAAGRSMILLVSGKAKKEYEMPFLPFLLGAYICVLMLNQGEVI